ncbi:OmpA family protein [bacterium]|nr:OmpA family protein [bacterium]
MKKLLLILLLLFSLLVYSENYIENFDSFSLATGNSSIVFSPSIESYNMNPANSTYFESGAFKLFIPVAYYNEEGWDIAKYYMDNKSRFSGDFDPLKDLDWGEVEYLLSKDPFVSLQLPLNFYILTKPDKWGIQTLFGLSTYAKLETSIVKGIVPPISSTISANLIGDIVIPFSISKKLKLFKKTVSLGTTFRYVHREKVNVDDKLTPSFMSYEPLLYNGDSFGVDIGAIVEFNDHMTGGFSVTDIGYSKFSWTVTELDDNNTEPLPIDIPNTFIKPRLNLGFTFFPEIKGLTRAIDNNFISISLNDIWGPSDHFMNHLKLGLGTRVIKIFNLFLGVNGGYPTAGFDIDLWVFHMTYSYFVKELGKFPGQIADRRHMFSLSFSGMKRIIPRENRFRPIIKKAIKKKDKSKEKVVKKEIKPVENKEELKKKVAAEQDLAEQKRLEEEKKQKEIEKMKKAADTELKNIEKSKTKTGTETKTEVIKKAEVVEEILGEKSVPKEEVLEEKTVPQEEIIQEKEVIPSSLKKYDARLTGKTIKMVMNIKFPSGKTLLSQGARSELETVYLGIKDMKGRILVNGYSDSSGSDALNLRLSQLRAEQVRLYFIKQGIDPLKIKATGYGESNPIATNETRDGRAKNRRIEIIIER